MALFVGFAFPFRKGLTSFPEQSTDDALIKQSLIQLILTGQGERIMRPEVGSNALAYVFENNDLILVQRISAEISDVVRRFEPRVALLSVEVDNGDKSKDNGPASVIVTIKYVVLATRTVGTLTITLATGAGP